MQVDIQETGPVERQLRIEVPTAEVDAEGQLACWFEEPAELVSRDRDACVAEEGWILGDIDPPQSR